MKNEDLKFLYQLDKKTLPILTAQIRVNPLRTEVLGIVHNDVIGFLTDTFGIEEKVVEDLARSYLEDPLNQLNNVLKKLIENSSELDDPKTCKDVKA